MIRNLPDKVKGRAGKGSELTTLPPSVLKVMEPGTIWAACSVVSLLDGWGEGRCRDHMTGDGNGKNIWILVTFQVCVYVRESGKEESQVLS